MNDLPYELFVFCFLHYAIDTWLDLRVTEIIKIVSTLYKSDSSAQ